MFINKVVKIFGSSNTTAIVEAVKLKNKYYISYSNGRDLVKTDPLKWSKFLQKEGVGEIILTCVNKEGLMEGFDIQLTKKYQTL